MEVDNNMEKQEETFNNYIFDRNDRVYADSKNIVIEGMPLDSYIVKILNSHMRDVTNKLLDGRSLMLLRESEGSKKS